MLMFLPQANKQLIELLENSISVLTSVTKTSSR